MFGEKEERREWSNEYKAESKTCRKLTREVKSSKEKLMVKWAIEVSSNSSGRLRKEKRKIIYGKEVVKFLVTVEKRVVI